MIKIESVKIKNYEAVDIVKGQINNSGVYGVKAVMDFSLELIHLRTLDSFKEVKGSTRDIVGVDFTTGFKGDIEISKDALRVKLYKEGFKINYINRDKHGNEISREVIEYVYYKRSSAKARVGKCLFIKKELYSDMIKWSNMNYEIPNIACDLVGIYAYNSLVSSSLKDTIEINPNNILLISDVESRFIVKNANIVSNVEVDGVKILKSVVGDGEICNSLWDGQSLVDVSLMDGHDMILLRNHFYKSAGFKCDIQKFFKDNGITKVVDMFGNVMRSEDVKIITTPNSCKFLKYTKLFGKASDNEMYQYWKDLVVSEGSIFGIVKTDKGGKYFDEEGEDIQQLSYQIVNSFNTNREELERISKWEINYVKSLKNNIEVFQKYLDTNNNIMNCYEMMIDLLNTKSKFKDTKEFRNFQSKIVSKYVDKIKGGKVKVRGSYNTVVGNPYEMLLHSIGKLPVVDGVLDSNYANEVLKVSEDHIGVYTKLFNEGEVTLFRNPHVSENNICCGYNYYDKDVKTIYDKYFNFGKYVCILNVIKAECMDLLGGLDFDSDTVLITNNETINTIAKRSFRVKKVCVNNIKQQKLIYSNTMEELAKLDNTLSKCKNDIGAVTNKGQMVASIYWHLKSFGDKYKDYIEKLEVILAKLTVVQGTTIDGAKRIYDFDKSEELKSYDKVINEILTKVFKKSNVKPNFWKYVYNPVGKDKDKQKKALENIKANSEKFNCPMDILGEVIEDGNDRKAQDKCINLIDLISNDNDNRKANRRQIAKIEEAMEKLDSIILKIKYLDTDTQKGELAELNEEVDNIYKDLSKIKMNEVTMRAVVNKCLTAKGVGKKKFIIFNILWKMDREKFLSIFDN